MIKILKGYPTKKSLCELLDKHNIRVNHMDTYKWQHAVHWSGEHNNEKADAVAAELRAEGFNVELRYYKRTEPYTGQLKIGAKQ